MFLSAYDFGVGSDFNKLNKKSRNLDSFILDFIKNSNDSFLNRNYKINDDLSLIFSIDIPGVDENDLSVEIIEDNILKISGERKTLNSSYMINKSYAVPDGYDLESVEAKLKNGVLTINIKSLPEKTKDVKKILINSK